MAFVIVIVMKSTKVFENVQLLDERPGDKDIFNLKELVSGIKTRLARQVKARRSSIIPVLGPFGTGKSTILNQVQNECSNYTWLNFELWRFANRQEIWDGFVIQLAAKLEKKDELELADEIDGTVNIQRSVKVQALIALFLLAGAYVMSWLLWILLQGASTFDIFTRAFLKYSFPVFVSIGLLGSLGVLVYKTRPTKEAKPIRRVFELEEILIKALKKSKQPIVVVAEDVDRAGDEGIVFLETLTSFMNTHRDDGSLNQSLIVLAPQSKDAFDALEHGGMNGFERSLKIYDEPIYVEPNWDKKHIEALYDALKTNKDHKEHLINATEILTSSYRGSISMRLLKHALREVSAFQEVFPAAKPEIALSVIMSRYIVVSDMSRQVLAQTKLFSGQKYGSGSLGGLIKAMIVSKGTAAGGEYLLQLKENLEDEVAFENGPPHPNGSVDTTVDIDSKYGMLRTPFA